MWVMDGLADKASFSIQEIVDCDRAASKIILVHFWRSNTETKTEIIIVATWLQPACNKDRIPLVSNSCRWGPDETNHIGKRSPDCLTELLLSC
jgi:hypothetical protein